MSYVTEVYFTKFFNVNKSINTHKAYIYACLYPPFLPTHTHITVCRAVTLTSVLLLIVAFKVLQIFMVQ